MIGKSNKCTKTCTAAVFFLLLCFVISAFALSSSHSGGDGAFFSAPVCGQVETDEQSTYRKTETLAAQPKAKGVNAFAANGTQVAAVHGGRLAAFVLLCVFGSLAALALVLFMLVFPLINRLAGTHIPCLDIFSSSDRSETHKTEPPEKSGKEKARSSKSVSRAKASERQTTRKSASHASQSAGRQERAPKVADSHAGYVDDRRVKTVRIDTLYHPEEESEITASAIDKAMRQALQENNKKGKK